MAETEKALVTGGAGFIGSHLVARLLDEGHPVAVIDDLSAGKLRNLDQRATFYHADITSPAVQDIINREQPDILFHLAGQTSVRHSSRDPVQDAQTNVIGALRLLEAVRRSGVDKVIYSSTGGALYGDPETVPCTEDTPILPLSPYGMSKYLAEQYVELYGRRYRLHYTILRYGNVYGPRQDPYGESGVVAIFTEAMLKGESPTIYGDGEQERDFVYVSDVVEANLKAMTRGDDEVFNIGTGQGASVNQIFKTLREITGCNLDAQHAAVRTGEVRRISLDCARANRRLGWSPQVGLREGLEQTAAFFQDSTGTGNPGIFTNRRNTA